ncbi:glycosyltransferase family 2 protein [Haloarcula sp. NS06]|uniref:glycosyltransferase family 2 protein n=1 Tax=Haloarcula sp. NS06 TaxID=3409688 RepID=UPI003DA6EE2B
MAYEVVIPSIKDEVMTLNSVPEQIPTHVVREGTLNEARNKGVKMCESDIVVILDDDISFSKSTLTDVVELVNKNTLVGMAESMIGLIMGRVMAFNKDLWRAVGGFDEILRSHNGDTDFAIRAVEQGFDLQRIPQSWFDHKEHPRSVTWFDWAWRLVYLSA